MKIGSIFANIKCGFIDTYTHVALQTPNDVHNVTTFNDENSIEYILELETCQFWNYISF